MVTIASPLRFEPFLRPLVWGGRKLATQLGKTLPTEDNYGESWEISDHALHASVIANGPLAGTTLHTLLQQHAHDILGPAAKNGDFPWLIKFLDAQDWLSVQVHPDDEQARRLRPGERGKTEAWLVLSAEAGSRIYAGLRPGTTPDDFRRALKEGNVAALLHWFPPQSGDFLFLPAGTVHAVGGGVVLAEVQQNSDATFRLFDWNRAGAQGKPRQLHVEEGLAAIDWSRGPVQPSQVPLQDESDVSMSLVRCPFFELSFFRRRAPFALEGQGSLRAVIVLAGQARIGQETLRAGEVWLFPACLPPSFVEPEPFVAGLACGAP